MKKQGGNIIINGRTSISNTSDLTLMELLIVMVILGMLAALAGTGKTADIGSWQ